ncbi:F-box/kelch-repeat protein At3g06240-like [Papaver somniferum]|uniref:F-box/kelch-repeat protein At3g06240-like n=1 Tax=Papaver somniferum TaxID=3469 RepID=UPI000E70068D|nr:F-box/kelch-repeat protein At3g06240-like [Papaver somniferum]
MSSMILPPHKKTKYRNSNHHRAAAMILLPEDVIQEILLRVPAESILNVKYVCKTLFSLVSNPSFVKHHLDHTIHNRKNRSKFMFMIQDGTKPYYPLVSTVSYDDTLFSNSSISPNRDDDCVEIDPPFIDLAIPIHFLGSCNGLICIMFQTSMVYGLVSFFVIWNPTTREYKVLPNSPTRVTNHYSSIYSFGYDYKHDDYKLVKGDFIQDGSVNMPPSEEDVYVSEVYSLQSDSWRSIDTIPYHMLKYIPFDSVSGVLVNGFRHWLAKRIHGNKWLREQFIVSFDFSEERFKQMQLPNGFRDNRPLHTVGVLEECLCVVNGVWVLGEPCYQLEIWVMQDYGVQESWTKRFVIHPTEHRQIFDLYPLRVIWSFKDDKILLLKTTDERQFVLYDPKKDTITSSSVPVHAAENYVESLVSLNSGIYMGSCGEYADNLHQPLLIETRQR